MGGNMKSLISQFADDTALYLSYDKLTLENVTSTLQCIEANTGFMVSYEKTLIYRIGSLANSCAMLYTSKEYQWTNKVFTLLGVQVDNSENSDLNVMPTLEKMKGILQNWYYRTLTLTGRILVVNTLCEWLFVYRLSVIRDVLPEAVTLINQEIQRFI